MFFYGVILSLTIGTVYLLRENQKDIDEMTEELNRFKGSIDEINDKQNDLSQDLAKFVIASSISKEAKERNVIFSNYFVGDGSSGNTTASGLSVDDFEVNDEGFYTYDGMVVVATGSTRLEGLKQGFVAHELFDKLLVEFNGKTYQSIALDVCGACTWGVDGETEQRIDIFTTYDVFGLENGKVIDIGK